MVIDRDYRYLIANRAFLAYRGLEREQVLGKRVAEVLHPNVFEDIIKPKVDECFRGNVVRHEMRYTYPERGERDLCISYFPIEGAAGIDRVACVLQDITERKQAEAALRTLSERLADLRDEERRHMAHELHDTTAQLLVALGMNLSVASESAGALPPHARAAIAESVALADRCLQEVRTVAYLLHARGLEGLSLESALRSYIDGFIQRSGIRVDVAVPTNLGRLPAAVETSIFRIVQECLSNIHRHSGSPTAFVRLMRGPSDLVVEIADAGRGMSEHATAGVGIASMRERLQLLNGRLEIASRPGSTVVQATVPLSD